MSHETLTMRPASLRSGFGVEYHFGDGRWSRQIIEGALSEDDALNRFTVAAAKAALDHNG